jgi:aldose 1-epimerase
MAINKISFLEEDAFQLENSRFKVTLLPYKGSNLISLFDKENQQELLRTPKTREEYMERRMLYGTPVLFPPNRIEDARFEFEGREYHLEMNRAKENVHIHGFVHDKKWKVVEQNDELNYIVTEINSADYEEILHQFPHDFVLRMKISLTDKGLKQQLFIKNLSELNMPTGIGYHTTFFFPIEQSKLSINLKEKWELNHRHLPTGTMLEVENKKEFKNGIILKGKQVDDVYPMLDRHANILHPELGIKLHYSVSDNFKHWVIFTSSGTEDFIAIEPYSWVTNAPNLDLPDEKTGMLSLKPNEEVEFQTEIKVEKL